VESDVQQVKVLIEQAKVAGNKAVQRGELSDIVWGDIRPLLIAAQNVIDEDIAIAAETLTNACNLRRRDLF
jgi:hypothetical protein